MNESRITLLKNIGNCYIFKKSKKKIGTGLGITLLLILIIFCQVERPEKHLQRVYIGDFTKK